jgi:hypothetical protein
MSNELIPYDQMRQMSADVVTSGLFPSLKKPEQVMTLMMLCQAEGLPPIKALQQYHIINGTPSKKADTLLAEFKKNGGHVKITKYSDEIVEGEFKTPDGSELTANWTIERAKKAGLIGRENWIKYPRAMLRARLIAEMVTTLMPEIKVGIQVYEEVIDNQPNEIKPPVETTVEIIDTEPKQKRTRKKTEASNEMMHQIATTPMDDIPEGALYVNGSYQKLDSTSSEPEQPPELEPEPVPEMQVPEDVNFDGLF